MSNYSFTKLFSSITDSSIWATDSDTRVVWVTMLAMADRQGRIFAALPGLANRARVSIENTERAIAAFLGPDKYSRTPDHEGRRIEVVDGGWRLLNYSKYRELRDDEAERERKRNWATKNRLKATKVAHDSAVCTQAEAEAEAEAGNKKAPFRVPTLEQVKFYILKAGLPESEAIKFWNHHEARGWFYSNGRKMCSISAAVGTWKSNYETYRRTAPKTADRNEGTANAGKASQYRDVGKVGPV